MKIRVRLKRRFVRKPSRMPSRLSYEDVLRHASRFVAVMSEADVAEALYELAARRAVLQKHRHTHELHIASRSCSACCMEALAVVTWNRIKAIERQVS
jgi:hypothetical protein